MITITLDQWSPTFLATGTNFVEGNFSMDCLNDSIALHLLCTLFLSLLYQLDLRSLGIRSWRSGTPDGLADKTPCFHYRGHGFDPWSGNQDLACLEMWPKEKKKSV